METNKTLRPKLIKAPEHFKKLVRAMIEEHKHLSLMGYKNYDLNLNDNQLDIAMEKDGELQITISLTPGVNTFTDFDDESDYMDYIFDLIETGDCFALPLSKIL